MTLISGLHILERVIQADTPSGVSALAATLKLPKRNIHRTLATLVEANDLAQDESGMSVRHIGYWNKG